MAASGLISILVWIIVLGCIFGLIWWLIGFIGLARSRPYQDRPGRRSRSLRC